MPWERGMSVKQPHSCSQQFLVPKWEAEPGSAPRLLVTIVVMSFISIKRSVSCPLPAGEGFTAGAVRHVHTNALRKWAIWHIEVFRGALAFGGSSFDQSSVIQCQRSQSLQPRFGKSRECVWKICSAAPQARDTTVSKRQPGCRIIGATDHQHFQGRLTVAQSALFFDLPVRSSPPDDQCVDRGGIYAFDRWAPRRGSP